MGGQRMKVEVEVGAKRWPILFVLTGEPDYTRTAWLYTIGT